MNHVAMGRIHAFCSYAHDDKAHLTDLEAALAELRKEAIIDQWSDERIQVGNEWDEEIRTSLDKAHLVLFVVTPSLLRSDYVNRVEIPRSLERRKEGRCEVVPILTVRPDNEEYWRRNQLAKIQPAPRVGCWISDYSDPKSAYNLVCLQVREACGKIGGGDNPYRRTNVGDWRLVRRRCEFPNGQLAEWEWTEVVVDKTDTSASVQVQTTMLGRIEDKQVTYDLTVPLREQAQGIASQVGMDLSQVSTMTTSTSAGGPDVSEELVTIGFKTYETRVLSASGQSEFEGLTMETHARTWVSIDVPIDGLVKARFDVVWPNGARGCQTVTLQDCGYGDAASRRPSPSVRHPLAPELATALGITLPEHSALGSRQTGTRMASGVSDWVSRARGVFDDFMSGVRQGSQQTPTPHSQIFPGRWMLQADDVHGYLSYDLILLPNGALQGMCWHNNVQWQVQGRWGFDQGSATLRIDVSAMMPGQPPSQYWSTFRITGSDQTAYHACDHSGRAFRIWMVQ